LAARFESAAGCDDVVDQPDRAGKGEPRLASEGAFHVAPPCFAPESRLTGCVAATHQEAGLEVCAGSAREFASDQSGGIEAAFAQAPGVQGDGHDPVGWWAGRASGCGAGEFANDGSGTGVDAEQAR